MAYEVLASAYDHLTGDVDYESTAASIIELLRHNGVHEGIILDLACGTGTLSYLLAQEGYEVIGVDASAEMLSVAEQKGALNASGIQPMFIMQDMRTLDLYGTVDACISMLDSVNYIIAPEDLMEVFRRVHLFLNPGGFFLFDINTPAHFAEVAERTFCDENEQEGVFCVWRVARTDEEHVYQYFVDLFTRERENSDVWRRYREEQFEYAYSPDVVKTMLQEAGFINIELRAGIDGEKYTGSEHRVYILAYKAT